MLTTIPEDTVEHKRNGTTYHFGSLVGQVQDNATERRNLRFSTIALEHTEEGRRNSQTGATLIGLMEDQSL